MKNGSRLSISRRITILSTLVTALILGTFGVFLDQLFSRHLKRQHQYLTASRLHFVEVELEASVIHGESEAGEIAEIASAFDRQNATRGGEEFHVEIRDDRGSSLLTMRGIEPVLAAKAPFPAPSSDIQELETNYWEAPNGHHYVLSSLRVPAGDRTRYVSSALDWSREEDRFELFRRKALIALLLGTMLSAVGSAAIARRALAPLRELAAVASRIEASRMSERIEPTATAEELRSLAAALAAMQSRLGESFTRLSGFASDLAHELRTPLNNVMGEIGVALRQPRENVEYRDVLGSVLEECQRLTRTIDGLLFLARSDHGAVQLRRSTFELRDELASIEDYYRLSAEDRGIEFVVEGSASISGDRDLVRQAVGNLVANAFQYVQNGGLVRVRIRENAGDGATIEVEDDGPGLSQDERSRVFDRFYRTAEARRARPGGSGLGLSIVRSIAELHHGTVSLEPRPEGGSVARLVLR